MSIARLSDIHRRNWHPINDYGLIGDLHTAAHVAPDGSIDWCCLPFFDSPSLFARILDHEKGGCFRVAPRGESHSMNTYLRRTNILKTTFQQENKRLALYDFMPLSGDGSKDHEDSVVICRLLECERGVNVEVEIEFDPRPDYARVLPTLHRQPHRVTCDDYPIQLVSSKPIQWSETTGRGTVVLSHGETLALAFAWKTDLPSRDLELWIEERLLETRHFWEDWISHCLYRGRWRTSVERSALALKLLTFKPTGAILAAPTTSLPEELGGVRNWDYRFSWIRDSALTLNALYLLGFHTEAKAFIEFLMSKWNLEDQLMILYPLRDEDTTPEVDLPHLRGYCDSRPVRIGNAAFDQLQLDVFGEMNDSLYLYSVYGEEFTPQMWQYMRRSADLIVQHWRECDEGIWEVRGGQFNFTYSKLMCWVGLDRALRTAEERGFEGDVEVWRRERDLIRSYIMDQCVDPELGYFTQSAEVRTADASNLLIALMGLVEPNDHRMLSTLDQTASQLNDRGFIYRYHGDDGLAGGEGTFNICTFWYIEALAFSGRYELAHEHFLRALEAAGSCGLMAEETDPSDNSALGNYPQGFSHIGLINAALTLGEGEERFVADGSETQAEPAASPPLVAVPAHAGS